MKISIIIPAYNVEAYILECIDSIDSKNNIDYEILVINDGSTDNTEGILTKVSMHNDRLKFFSTDNNGQSIARNFGVEKSTGEFILFLDADDKLAPNSLDKLFSIIEDNEDIKICFFNGSSFYEDESLNEFSFNYKRKESLGNKVKNLPQFASEQIISGQFIASPVLYIFHRSLFVENKFFPGIIHEDNLFTAKLMLLNDVNSLVIPDTLYLRRVRHGSVMTSVVKLENIIGYLTCAYELSLIKPKLSVSLHQAVEKLCLSWYIESWRLNRLFNLGGEHLIQESVKKSRVKNINKFFLLNEFLVNVLIGSKGIIKVIRKVFK